MSKPRVCVIGAGIAGLTSSRYLKEKGVPFTTLEASKYVGGLWRYEPRIGEDENGEPIRTSMYKGLRTNLSVCAMELRGFPVPEDMPAYPTWKTFYEYIKSYAKHFNLEKFIKFQHEVTLVKREGNLWKVIYRHIPSKTVFEEYYDYVVISSGHYDKPHLPEIPRQEAFKGNIFHSRDYKEPEKFKNLIVLMVGMGASGMDIALEVSSVAKTVFHSHHLKEKLGTPFPLHYIMKPDLKEFTETGAVFADGTVEEFDDVIFCTGFEYHYPFLDETCGVIVKPQYITPLHKSIVNINQPTMLFVGAIQKACNVIALDAQARYATALIAGEFTLPSKNEMMKEQCEEVKKIRNISKLHVLGDNEDEYYEKLTKESGIDRVPPVMTKIRLVGFQRKLENFNAFRKYKIEIVDENNFVRRLDPYSGSDKLEA